MPGTDFAYAVKGRWPFPVDMLRRDQAVPASPSDAALIEALSGDLSSRLAGGAGGDDGISTVNLVIPDAGRQRPNAERWASFGWEVPGDETRRFEREERARVAAHEAHLLTALEKLTPEELAAVEWRAVRRLGL